MSMFHYYNLGCTEAFIFDEFLVNQIREGITITPEHNKKLTEVIDKHFHGKPVVYISNRVNSYTVNPITYLGTSKIHNLLAITIVSDKLELKEAAAFESDFYTKPYEIFDNLSEAVEWVHKVVLERMD